MKIAIITACGNKKEPIPLPAHKLYKSPRIKTIYNRRQGHDMFILSAEHGLIPADKIIRPYNRLMDEQRCDELIPHVAESLQKYDVVIYFRGGSGLPYKRCVTEACDLAGVELDAFGSRMMEGIRDLSEKIRRAEQS